MTWHPTPDDPEPVEEELPIISPPGWADVHVEVTEPVKVGEILGPDGQPLMEMYDRNTVPIGFQPPEAPGS